MVGASVEDVILRVNSWSRLTRRVATTVYTIIDEKRREESERDEMSTAEMRKEKKRVDMK